MNPLNHIPGLGSSIFILIGLVFVYLSFYFKRHGKRHTAKLIGYKKALHNMSTTRNVRSERIMYTKLFQLDHQGQSYKIFENGSSSTMGSEIGSTKDIFILNNNPNYYLFAKSYELFFGLIFLTLGSILLYASVISNVGVDIGLAYLLGYIFIIISFVKYKMKEAKVTFKECVEKMLYKEPTTEDEISKMDIISSNKELEDFHIKHSKVGLIVCLIFIGFLVGLSYVVWNDSSRSLQQMTIDLLSNPVQSLPEIKRQLKAGNKLLIMLTFSGVLIIPILFSTLKQMALFLRR